MQGRGMEVSPEASAALVLEASGPGWLPLSPQNQNGPASSRHPAPSLALLVYSAFRGPVAPTDGASSSRFPHGILLSASRWEAFGEKDARFPSGPWGV